jgi:hypothetical protein
LPAVVQWEFINPDAVPDIQKAKIPVSKKRLLAGLNANREPCLLIITPSNSGVHLDARPDFCLQGMIKTGIGLLRMTFSATLPKSA